MMIADAVILNQDRHLGNSGFIVENDSGKIVKQLHYMTTTFGYFVMQLEIKQDSQ